MPRVGAAAGWTPSPRRAGVPGITPYFLAAHVRVAAQRLSLQEIADEMGHDVDVLAKTHAHVISEYRGHGPINPVRADPGGAPQRPETKKGWCDAPCRRCRLWKAKRQF